MVRRKLKRKIDQQLLETIVQVKLMWKKTEHMIEKSVEIDEEMLYYEKIAKAKYVFLLKQARTRKLNSIQF